MPSHHTQPSGRNIGHRSSIYKEAWNPHIDRVVPISEARARLGELIAEADDHPVYVMRHGRPAGVILSLTKFEGLIDRIEDLDDALSVATATDAVAFTRTTD